MQLKAGQVITFERTFTKEDVEKFTELSLDRGEHHVAPDEKGRYMVQGLLTATLPTKIGGDYNVLARTMNFEFIRPVYTGDAVTCVLTVDQCEKTANRRTRIAASFTCTNQYGKEVAKGSFTGVILGNE